MLSITVPTLPRAARPRPVRALVLLCLVATAAAADPRPAPAADPALQTLGRQLFFDGRLSASGRQSCATCHDPRYAYGPRPGEGLAKGGPHLDRLGSRAVPSLRYLQAVPDFTLTHRFTDGDIGPAGGYTWDGRARSIGEQARLPLLDPDEMANRSAAEVARRLNAAGYRTSFEAIFGPGVLGNPDRALAAATEALAAFQRTPAEFYPYSSRYDAFLRGELELTDAEAHGVELFKDPKKGNCASCHAVLTRAGVPPVFTDYDLLNIGVPRNPRIPANADPAHFDLGLCGPKRTDLAAERRYCGFFRAPSMRNTAIRAAYFHNGVYTTLDEVMHFYVERDLYPEKYYPRAADGTVRKFDDLPPELVANIDHDAPMDRPPGAEPALSDAEIADLMAFLKTLTDADVAR